jgi:hypothetical protein
MILLFLKHLYLPRIISLILKKNQSNLEMCDSARNNSNLKKMMSNQRPHSVERKTLLTLAKASTSNIFQITLNLQLKFGLKHSITSLTFLRNECLITTGTSDFDTFITMNNRSKNLKLLRSHRCSSLIRNCRIRLSRSNTLKADLELRLEH